MAEFDLDAVQERVAAVALHLTNTHGFEVLLFWLITFYTLNQVAKTFKPPAFFGWTSSSHILSFVLLAEFVHCAIATFTFQYTVTEADVTDHGALGWTLLNLHVFYHVLIVLYLIVGHKDMRAWPFPLYAMSVMMVSYSYYNAVQSNNLLTLQEAFVDIQYCTAAVEWAAFCLLDDPKRPLVSAVLLTKQGYGGALFLYHYGIETVYPAVLFLSEMQGSVKVMMRSVTQVQIYLMALVYVVPRLLLTARRLLALVGIGGTQASSTPVTNAKKKQ
jgi:hypothetical protein